MTDEEFALTLNARRAHDFMKLRAMARQSQQDAAVFTPGWIVEQILRMSEEHERLIKEHEKKR